MVWNDIRVILYIIITEYKQGQDFVFVVNYPFKTISDILSCKC